MIYGHIGIQIERSSPNGIAIILFCESLSADVIQLAYVNYKNPEIQLLQNDKLIWLSSRAIDTLGRNWPSTDLHFNHDNSFPSDDPSFVFTDCRRRAKNLARYGVLITTAFYGRVAAFKWNFLRVERYENILFLYLIYVFFSLFTIYYYLCSFYFILYFILVLILFYI